MHLHKVEIKNFRLLASVALCLEERTTLIVGRNNSGKTSLTELFRRLLRDNSPTFDLEDFSLSALEGFWNAFLLKTKNCEEREIRNVLPVIEVKLLINYDKNASSLGPLGEFIIDLEPACTQALIVIRYQLKDGQIDAFFEDIDYNGDPSDILQKKNFFRTIKNRLHQRYSAIVLAVDPNDPTNQKNLDWSKLRTLIDGGFINAQRGLDDMTHRERDILGKILEALFRTATGETAHPKDREIVQKLENAVQGIQTEIDEGFTKQLKDLLPAFEIFGYPGLSDPRLSTETTLDVQRLLTDHTRIHYAGINGINLPESYNGLGVRNLIFILLKLLEFFKSFVSKGVNPGIHLIFIEEPEVHLHPQMQEVFINKLNDIAQVFAQKFNNGQPWPAQFIVTTHSSHLANKASFDSMRYFLATSDEKASHVRSTQIKDLREGLDKTPQVNRDFLHKYMTLTRCDLLFADKAVIIEGTTERLLLPEMIKKVDAETPGDPQLSSQYVSIVEVGGAYAHLFFDLLNFLQLRTLVITDLDTVNQNGRSCNVSEGTDTRNPCIKEWFNDAHIPPSSLLQKCDEEKTFDNIRRLAYQIPEMEDKPCGRSFEDAFILANPNLFGLTEISEAKVCEKAESVKKKTDFALEYAIQKTIWNVPRYIREGLCWLREGARCLAVTTSPTNIDAAVAVDTPAQQEEIHA